MLVVHRHTSRQAHLHANFKKKKKTIFQKNKMVVVALGRSPSDEYKDNLHQVSKKLRGDAGLPLTNYMKEEVTGCFTKFIEMDFA